MYLIITRNSVHTTYRVVGVKLYLNDLEAWNTAAAITPFGILNCQWELQLISFHDLSCLTFHFHRNISHTSGSEF